MLILDVLITIAFLGKIPYLFTFSEIVHITYDEELTGAHSMNFISVNHTCDYKSGFNRKNLQNVCRGCSSPNNCIYNYNIFISFYFNSK